MAWDSYDGDITSSIVVGGLPIDTSTTGTHIVTYDVTDSSGNPAPQVTRTVNVISSGVDTTPPVITLLGVTPINIVLGSTYVDAGATAWDNVDGDITSSIIVGGLPVDTSAVGTNIITYDVTDSSGNPATQVTRTVNVYDPSVSDTTPPTIIITSPGNTIYNVPVNQLVYTASDASGLDGCWYSANGGLTINYVACNIPISLSSTEGLNTWVVYARDTYGNQASTNVIFTVDTGGGPGPGNDTTAPIITVISPQEGREYDDSEIIFEITTNEAVSNAWFNVDGVNITMNNHNNSLFNYALTLPDGDYDVAFHAMDLAGNTGTASVSFSIDDDDDSDRDDDDDDDDDWKSRYLLAGGYDYEGTGMRMTGNAIYLNQISMGESGCQAN